MGVRSWNKARPGVARATHSPAAKRFRGYRADEEGGFCKTNPSPAVTGSVATHSRATQYNLCRLQNGFAERSQTKRWPGLVRGCCGVATVLRRRWGSIEP